MHAEVPGGLQRCGACLRPLRATDSSLLRMRRRARQKHFFAEGRAIATIAPAASCE